MTFLFLGTSHVVIANYDEWLRIGRWAGLSVPDCGETDPEAPSAAVSLLRALKARHWAGSEVAVATLGRQGAVIMDWLEDRAYHIALELLDHPGVPTPVGAGDLFLAEWVYHETWARRGHLRVPLAACGLRVTHAVVKALGLRRGDYDVRVVPL
jgi:sugar/nucleoside kinase (ribokinase family)